MKPIALQRRIAIAACTLILAAALFRGQIASALVTRGDDALRSGDAGGAIRYYSRALAVDGASIRAADRLAFYLALRRAPGDAQAAIAVATAALARVPADPALLADRGFAEQRLRRWSAAERDFARAGAAGHDPRYDHFAGRIAQRLGDETRARSLFAAALHSDPAFGPARTALAELR
jgi:tetratricopeptide (TPR) repeat protein